MIFLPYRKNTIYRRIERRMGIHQIDNIATYVLFLQENLQEVELLIKEFLIEPVEFPTAFAHAKYAMKQQLATVQNIQLLADKLILQCYSPTTVLLNVKGDILYITGRTGKYLEPASGKVNWNIFAMARDGLSYNLSNTFYKALRQKKRLHTKTPP